VQNSWKCPCDASVVVSDALTLCGFERCQTCLAFYTHTHIYIFYTQLAAFSSVDAWVQVQAAVLELGSGFRMGVGVAGGGYGIGFRSGWKQGLWSGIGIGVRFVRSVMFSHLGYNVSHA